MKRRKELISSQRSKFRTAYPRCPKTQRGASMVEFIIVTPLLMFFGLGIMQFGLIYHAKSILNYATFEAARSGAVNNAQIDIMRKEFGYRMAPVFGGSGELRDGVSAIARSAVYAQDPSITKIETLNPTRNSFAVHGKMKDVVDSHGIARSVTAIPNSHMRVRDNAISREDGLNIQDANLLKIRVTYGYQMRLPFLDMEIPGVAWTMRNVMMQSDPDNWMYYIRGLLPLTSTATVRMQSEAWDGQLEPIAVRMFDAIFKWTRERVDELAEHEEDEEDENENEGETGDDGDSENNAGCDPKTGLPFKATIKRIDPSSCPMDTPPYNDGNNGGNDQVDC